MKYKTLANIMTNLYETGPLAVHGALVALWAVDRALEEGHSPSSIKDEYSALFRARDKAGVPVLGIPYGHPCFGRKR